MEQVDLKEKLDETDLLIIEILGKESPVIKCFEVSDLMGLGGNQETDLTTNTSDVSTVENVVK